MLSACRPDSLSPGEVSEQCDGENRDEDPSDEDACVSSEVRVGVEYDCPQSSVEVIEGESLQSDDGISTSGRERGKDWLDSRIRLYRSTAAAG